MTGTVFDIQEFSVNDGPGIRVTVFLKGCPLRCRWCHNPEGQSFEPQMNLKTGLLVGRTWSADGLADYLVRFKDAFELSNGGVTFSGGEPTAQGEFLIETARKLRAAHVHVNMETSGWCERGLFERVLNHLDLVYCDLKCMDAARHKELTGVDNGLILENVRAVAKSTVPYRIRVPLIPGVSDTDENRKRVELFVRGLPRQPELIEWLPYNKLAAAKYPVYGMEYGFETETSDE